MDGAQRDQPARSEVQAEGQNRTNERKGAAMMKKMLLTLTAVGMLAVPAGFALAQDEDPAPIAAEIERVRADEDFTARAKKLLDRDREILDRLAK
jgi:hypothetical protein